MKRASKVILVAIMTVLLVAGCSMREHVGFTVSDDKTLSFDIIFAMDKEMIDAMSNNGGMSFNTDDTTTTTTVAMTDAKRWEYLKDSIKDFEGTDTTTTKYEDGDFMGYKVSKKLGSIDEYTKESADAKTVLKEMQIKQGDTLFVKNNGNYKTNFAFDEDEFKDVNSYKQMGAIFDLKFIINTPEKAVSNNATSVSDDGKTYTWDLLETRNIELEFGLGNASGVKSTAKGLAIDNANLMIYIGVGGLCLVLIIVVIAVMSSKRKKNVDAAVDNDIPVNPVTPITTVEPTEPESVPVDVPATPVEPVVPEVSAEPVVPETPVEPQVPDAPVEPTVPTVPTDNTDNTNNM